MKNENTNLSNIELIDEYLKSSNDAKTLTDIINYVSTTKNIDSQDIETINQLYLDMTSSGKYVYIGDNKWDLKERNLEYWDKEGTAFISEEERAALEDLDEEDDIDLEEFDYDHYQQKIKDMEDGKELDDVDAELEEISQEDDEEKAYLDIELPTTTDEDFDKEDYEFNYNDDEFDKDEDKYNDLMDEFEDLYEDK